VPEAVRRRIFIGGCSRSGTTLLQGLLAGHSRIHTFPETGVFLRALGMRGHVLPWTRLGLTLGKERKALIRLSEQLGLDGSRGPPLPPRRIRLHSSVRDVVGFFDSLTLAEGRDIWLEKTPRHILHAARIRRLVPASVFIHLIRSGGDVVASIVDRARQHPDRFRGQEDPAYGVRQWNQSIRATARAMAEPGHLVLRYEGLAAHPEETLQAICRQVGIEFQDEMLTPGGQTPFILEEEAWKAPRQGPLRPAPSKYTRIFDESTRERIDDGLEMSLLALIEDRLRSSPGQVWGSGVPMGQT
jgi:hypothetical protein